MVAPGGEQEQRVKRINVAVNADELAAITLLIEREQISSTEAVRRLLLYGEALYIAIAAGREVVLSGGGLPPQKLVLLGPPTPGRDSGNEEGTTGSTDRN